METITLINDNAPDIGFNGNSSPAPGAARTTHTATTAAAWPLDAAGTHRTAGGSSSAPSTGYIRAKDRRKAAEMRPT